MYGRVLFGAAALGGPRAGGSAAPAAERAPSGTMAAPAIKLSRCLPPDNGIPRVVSFSISPQVVDARHGPQRRG